MFDIYSYTSTQINCKSFLYSDAELIFSSVLVRFEVVYVFVENPPILLEPKLKRVIFLRFFFFILFSSSNFFLYYFLSFSHYLERKKIHKYVEVF